MPEKKATSCYATTPFGHHSQHLVACFPPLGGDVSVTKKAGINPSIRSVRENAESWFHMPYLAAIGWLRKYDKVRSLKYFTHHRGSLLPIVVVAWE